MGANTNPKSRYQRQKRLSHLSGGLHWFRGGGEAPCLVECYPLEGVKPQMLEQVCCASLGRAELPPSLPFGCCPDLLGAPHPGTWAVPCDSTVWVGGGAGFGAESGVQLRFEEGTRGAPLVRCWRSGESSLLPHRAIWGCRNALGP